MSDILCISTTDWDEIWGSRQQIMLRLAARGHRVLFVERQVGPEQLLRSSDLRQRKFKAWSGNPLHPIAESVWRWQPPLLLPGRYYSQQLNHWGQQRLARHLRPILSQLGFENVLLWLYPPQSAALVGQFNEVLSIYHCIERFAGIQKGIKRKTMIAEEEKLLRQVDLVFTHAEGLRQLYQPLARRPILLVPSAADVNHFQSSPEIRPEIAQIPQPRLGIVGTLDDRIDIEMLSILARQHPDWHLIFIGHIRSERLNLAPLLALTNVHYLDKRSFQELPEFLNGMNANLVPYLLNEMTRFISPLKVYEYLAVGKPVISVDLPEVRRLSEWVTIVPTTTGKAQTRAQAFAAGIQQTLDANTPGLESERRKVAWQHTWDERVNKMWEIIENLMQERQP